MSKSQPVGGTSSDTDVQSDDSAVGGWEAGSTMTADTVVDIRYDEKFRRQIEADMTSDPVANITIRVDDSRIFGENPLPVALDTPLADGSRG